MGIHHAPVDVGRPDRGETSVAHRLVAPLMGVATQVLQELAGVFRLPNYIQEPVSPNGKVIVADYPLGGEGWRPTQL